MTIDSADEPVFGVIKNRIENSPEIDPAVVLIDDDRTKEMLDYAELVLAGGTVELGRRVADGIMTRVTEGKPLKHSLILQATRVGVKELVVEDIPMNRGIFDGFRMQDVDMGDIRSGSTLVLGVSGIEVVMNPLFVPEDEISLAEKCGLRKSYVDESGVKASDAGFVLLPTYALRAFVLSGAVVSDPEVYRN